MASGGRARLQAVIERIARDRRLDGVIGLLAVPHLRTRRGTNVVIAEHYGMLLGRTFANDDEAAQHYFREGWKLGVVPSPFIDAPAVRFATAASVLLRNQLARVARGADPRSRWLGTPSRLITGIELTDSLNDRGGWVAALTDRARRDPRSVLVRVGSAELTWEQYLESARAATPAAAVVLQDGLIDIPFYESQVGHNRVISPSAALDDYVSNGEVDGRAPNPFFEAEWYQATDRSQARRVRPLNLLLDFVATGELGPASPQFWGKRYAEALGDALPAGSLLAQFLARARADDLCPSCDGVDAVSRELAERISRERVADYHRALDVRHARGPVLRKHPVAVPRPDPRGTCLVIVDERHVRTAEAVDALAVSMRQSIAGLRVAVIESEDVARIAQLDEAVRATAFMDFIPRRGHETIGAVIGRLLDDAVPDSWTIWTPGERWDSDYLATATSALKDHKETAAAAAVAGTTPQPWLRTRDALWVNGLSGAGVVFRGTGAGMQRPDPALDFGIAPHLLITIADSGKCAVLNLALVVTAIPDTLSTESRGGLNAARNQHLVSFDAAPADGVCVVIPTFQDWRMTVTAVGRVLETTGADTTVVVIDNGSRRPVAGILATCFASEARVVIRRMPVNTDFAVGSNIGASTVPSRTTVFLNNDTSVQDGWLDPLMSALDEGVGAVQPLLLFGDRTVQTAGTIFLGGISMPRHLFAEVHVMDVPAGLDDYPFSALTAACVAVRYTDLASLGGFDPHFVNGMEDVDFCLRLKQRGRPLRVRTESRVIHFESRTAGRGDHQVANRRRFAQHWRQALSEELDDRAVFDLGEIELVSVQWNRHAESPLWEPTVVMRRRDSALRVNEAPPRLRWAIKSSATGDFHGDSWGDTFFAQALAEALERLGQEAVVDRITSHVRPSNGWDDVTLTLRGLTPFLPQPGALNLLWVISHPDLITKQEVESGYARVYSAGAKWAQFVREHWGFEARTLLQATDATKFFPGVGAGEADHGTLFVGRTRGVSRPIVTDVIAAGGDPEVYGDDGWEQFIDPRYVRGTGIANDDVPRAYANSQIVLNDHWRDMADFGFFSNRLFDATAAGARVISDHVDGIDALFGGQVRTYRDLAELSELLDPAASAWPDDVELAGLAERVVLEHSFDARARVLLSDALELRAQGGSL